MALDELQVLCAEWQKRLRLQDWKVKVTFCRMRDMDDAYGHMDTRNYFKEADIQIADPVDRTDASPDIEQTLVHELVHIHFAQLETPEGYGLTMFENGIDLTAWALVNLKRENKSTSSLVLHNSPDGPLLSGFPDGKTRAA